MFAAGNLIQTSFLGAGKLSVEIDLASEVPNSSRTSSSTSSAVSQLRTLSAILRASSRIDLRNRLPHSRMDEGVMLRSNSFRIPPATPRTWSRSLSPQTITGIPACFSRPATSGIDARENCWMNVRNHSIHYRCRDRRPGCIGPDRSFLIRRNQLRRANLLGHQHCRRYLDHCSDFYWSIGRSFSLKLPAFFFKHFRDRLTSPTRRPSAGPDPRFPPVAARRMRVTVYASFLVAQNQNECP